MPPITLELYRKRTCATGSVGLGLRVRFRYSRLKEAALFAADAMGFQSTLVWKLLKKNNICGASFKSTFIDLTMKPRLTIASS
jgi:hypothetical protein